MNGAFYIARKSFESDLWRNKPSAWWKIWCFVLGSVQHADYKEIKRGQGYFNFTELVKMGVLGDTTINQVEKFIKYAKWAEMIKTVKATHGMFITVLHYNQYQDTNTYKSGTENEDPSGTEAEQKRNRSGDINNNDKNDKNVKKNNNIEQTSKNSLTPCNGEELLLIAKLKNIPIRFVEEVHEEIMNLIQDGIFQQRKYGKTVYFTLMNWLQMKKNKGQIPGIKGKENISKELTPLSYDQLWGIATDLEIPLEMVVLKHNTILDKIVAGEFFHDKISPILQNWLRGDIEKGQLEKVDEIGRLTLIAQSPEHRAKVAESLKIIAEFEKTDTVEKKRERMEKREREILALREREKND